MDMQEYCPNCRKAGMIINKIALGTWYICQSCNYRKLKK